MASFLVKESRWNAGALLMQLADPISNTAIETMQLAQTNEATLADCRSQAVGIGREQRCGIVVPALDLQRDFLLRALREH